MTQRLLMVIGPPAVGKTTLVEASWPSIGVVKQAGLWFTHRQLGVVEIGRMRPGGYAGSDGLAMNVGPTACAWVASNARDRLLVEGDRLSYRGFIEAARRGGYRCTLVALSATPRTLAERRARRGSSQDSAWLAGRETKITNLIEWAVTEGLVVERLNAEAGPVELAARLRPLLR